MKQGSPIGHYCCPPRKKRGYIVPECLQGRYKQSSEVDFEDRLEKSVDELAWVMQRIKKSKLRMLPRFLA